MDFITFDEKEHRKCQIGSDYFFHSASFSVRKGTGQGVGLPLTPLADVVDTGLFE